MDLLMKAAAIAVSGAAIALLLKKNTPEISVLVSVISAVAILMLTLDRFLDISGFIGELVEAAGLSPAVVSPVVKTVGIGLITKLSSDICKDAGQNTACTVVETAGSIAAVTVALPLMKTVFRMISSLI